jgi:hypothetical protein
MKKNNLFFLILFVWLHHGPLKANAVELSSQLSVVQMGKQSSSDFSFDIGISKTKIPKFFFSAKKKKKSKGLEPVFSFSLIKCNYKPNANGRKQTIARPDRYLFSLSPGNEKRGPPFPCF